MDDQITKPVIEDACPGCGTRGKSVGSLTVESLTTPEAKARVGDSEGYRFCSETSCDVVYYRPDGRDRYSRGDLLVRVGQKETAAPRPLCYCFGYSVEDVAREIAAGEPDRIRQSIVGRCRLGEDRCAETNPQGSCCLGNVGRVYPRTRSASNAEAAAEASVDCCATTPAAAVGARSEAPSRAGRLATGGAVLAAAASSACCWLPLMLLAFGASAAGVAGFFESFRPYFLSLSGLLLAGGFYLVYLRKPACEPGTACTAPEPRLSRLNKAMLWTATAFTVLLALFPTYVEHLVVGDETIGVSSPSGEVRLYRVDGMTCEGCASGLAARLRSLPSVHGAEVDYEAGQAKVDMDSDRDNQAVLDAISTAGFQGRWVD